MRFCSLGSGSGGNATLIEASQGITSTQLLLDCGFSLRELGKRLQRAGSSPEQLGAVFITHEHGDHVGCVLNLCQRFQIPLWTSRGTWKAIGHEDFDPRLLHLVRDGDFIDLGDLALQPFAVPHDAREPLHLRCHDGLHHLGLLTDLGCATPSVIEALQGCHALLLECNHDEDLLRNSSYPASLKRRILGSHGHLCNQHSADLLRQCLHAELGVVVAAHLSERNNRPELAAQALAAALDRRIEDIPVASQSLGTDWFSLR
ncbi:phosphoribosyl 1,2-cyclic phosphodiesterase [Paucibacter oligotrophus]|uniref:Phosphoribosyl 1,2-cyclic phosphodiesterase n=1 Tax=Roseateles oligotrophus TaxID=1769250 RepID=A0A840LCZ8_9BURK|nr:MBL fold metallo-hydrolase [Roseateles oligotrophus]MBB4843939.1 phosphoribosyl 1,2-cyclic phosphodiesterase [Roseateles oligotrophus]